MVKIYCNSFWPSGATIYYPEPEIDYQGEGEMLWQVFLMAKSGLTEAEEIIQNI
jgi:hypothetical protein